MAVQRHTVALDVAGTSVPATLYLPSAPTPRPAYVFLQGANAEGARYAWLAGLAEHGYAVLIPDLPAKEQLLPGGTGTMRMILPTVALLDAAIRWLADMPAAASGALDGRVVVGGHSWGGMVAIIALDAARRSTHGFAGFPEGYQVHPSISGAAVVGAHLQTGDTNPTSALRTPRAGFPTLFIAAANDGLSPPQNVRLSAGRIDGGADYAEIAGGTHFQWCAFTGPGDQTARDGQPEVPADDQQSETIRTIAAFLDRSFPA